MIVGPLTICHTQYTWDRSICIFYLIEQHSKFLLHTLQVLCMCTLFWFYKHQHDNRVRSTQNAFSLRFAAILVNCAPSGEMHNYCTPHIIKKTLRISWSISTTTYCYLRCIVYAKLLKPRQSFLITLYITACSNVKRDIIQETPCSMFWFFGPIFECWFAKVKTFQWLYVLGAVTCVWG